MLVSYIFIQEAGDEEKKEVSLALKKLRKQYDDIHKMTVEKENELELLKVSHLTLFIFLQIGLQKIQEEEKKVERDATGSNTESDKAKIE